MERYSGDLLFRPIAQWPGRETEFRPRSPFKAGYQDTIQLLRSELGWLKAKDVVVQLDVAERDIRIDGQLRANVMVRGPRVVLALGSKFGPLTYPCDQFYSWQENLRAIALALYALRAVDRYGVTRRGEQYTGWKQLPGGPIEVAMMPQQAAEFMASCCPERNGTTVRDILQHPQCMAAWYRTAAFQTHPDRTGGNDENFKRLQEAKRVLDQHHAEKF